MKVTNNGLKPFTWKNLVRDFTLPITQAKLLVVQGITAKKLVAILDVRGTISANRSASRRFVTNLRKETSHET
jgi:hypothetical protein